MALTGKRHSLKEVDAALIMINKMITNASKDSILNLSPLPSKLMAVKTQLTELKGRGQEWEEKEANRVRGGGLHNLALTNKIHTLEEVGAALIMIEKMITNASKNSILKILTPSRSVEGGRNAT
jgi:hypothetical protein